jgi:outer membrane protein
MIAFLSASCGNGGNADNKDANSGQNQSESSVKSSTTLTNVAYIRVDSIIQNYDMYHDLKRKFDAVVKKKEDEFAAKQKALERDARDFKEKYDKMLMTQSQAAEQSQRLQARSDELGQKIYPEMRAQLEEEQAVMLRQINDAILKYVEKYNVEKKYTMILNSAVIITGDPSMDITAEILKGLNAEYIANRNVTPEKTE